MPNVVIDASLKDAHGEQITIPASNATKEVYGRRLGFNKVMITGTAAYRIALCPSIQSLWHYDDSATPQWVNLLDENKAVINRHAAAGTGSLLDDMATADFLYIGTNEQHGGFFFDMLSVNGTAASTLTMSYSKSDVTFASQAITDGTSSGAVTWAQDGNITLDAIPSDWTNQSLATMLSDAAAPNDKLYWVRFDSDKVMDSDTEIGEIVAFHATPALASATGSAAFYDATTTYTFNVDADVGGFEIAEIGTVGSKTVNLSQFDLR